MKYASSEQTREALINAAGELAAEHGFSSVSTRAIAQRAQENIGSIHYHFGGKEQLFEAVVRQVTGRGKAFTLHEAIEPYLGLLDTPTGQEGALRSMVRREIDILFDPEQPRWHTRIVYQLIQYKSPLQDILFDELMTPFTAAITSLLKRIKPSLEDDEIILHAALILSPIATHADYMPFFLEQLKTDRYDPEYLQKMEALIVRQTKLLLGLEPEQQQPSQAD